MALASKRKPARGYALVRHHEDLGEYLQRAREAKGLTQREVSLELGYSSPQFISNFERGISAPPVRRLRVLIKRYGISQTKVVQLLLAGDQKQVLQRLNS